MLLIMGPSEASKISDVKTITTQKTGKRGRPRKIVSESFLREAFKSGRNISISRVATSLGVHRNSVKNYMKLYNVVKKPYSSIADPLLDSMVKCFKDSHPNAGIRYIRGFFLHQGIRVQRSRILAALSRVDSVAKVVLRNKTIKRREYKSARPNALWHMDGHHKLGPWGIVIHGITDGFDRVVGLVDIKTTLCPLTFSMQITGMKVSTHNTAQTVLSFFLQAIAAFGCPSRVRGDRGSENVDVCTWMIMYRGPNRASFMWGT